METEAVACGYVRYHNFTKIPTVCPTVYLVLVQTLETSRRLHLVRRRPSCLFSAKICTTVTLVRTPIPRANGAGDSTESSRECAIFIAWDGVWGKETTLWVAGHTGAVPALHASDPQYLKSLTTIAQSHSLSYLPAMPVYTCKSQRFESMSLFCCHAGRHFYTGRFWSKYTMWNRNS
jgi:hypothetical protein